MAAVLKCLCLALTHFITHFITMTSFLSSAELPNGVLLRVGLSKSFIRRLEVPVARLFLAPCRVTC